MSKDLKDIDLKSLPQQLSQLNQRLSRYRIILFVIFITSVYGFVYYKIVTLSDPTTDTSGVTAEVNTLTPRIDDRVAHQLESLKDNSVNVRSLFDKARQSPFAE